MIGTATFVMLIAATAIADNAYPPCTQHARITAAHSNKHQGPRSISRAPKENTARHRYPAPQEAAVNHAQPHRHFDLQVQAPAAEAEGRRAGGAGDRAAAVGNAKCRTPRYFLSRPTMTGSR